MRFQLSNAFPYLKPIVPEDDPALVMNLEAEDSPVMRPFFGGLLTSYVVDEGSHFTYVQERHLTTEDCTRAALHARALANLASSVSKTGVRCHPYGKIFALTFDGNFEATLMLLDEFWETLELHVGKELLAVAPTRDVLAVGPLEHAVESELRGVMERARGGDHALNEDLYHRSAGTWRVARSSR